MDICVDDEVDISIENGIMIISPTRNDVENLFLQWVKEKV